MARLTICLPVYNGADFIEEALRSIEAQTSSDYAVLASDNASTDNTRQLLDHWTERLPMEVLTQPATVPMRNHFNLLLDRVETEFYMVLCHDDYLYNPKAVASALAIADAEPAISAIYCDLAYVSETNRALATRRFAREGKIQADELGRESLRRARNMFGIPLLVRSDALGMARYDPRFHYLMDVDLSWTISRDQPAWHIPDVLIANRYRKSNMTWGLLANAAQEYVRLAEKYDVELSTSDRIGLYATNWTVGQKKRVFGLYERLVTRFG